MELSKNKPAWYSHIEKICPWTKFQPPTWLLAPPGPVLVFWPQKNYPCGCCHLKINHPSLHTLKKYVSGPSFNLLHGWLHQVPFSHFGHKTTYPCRWRNPKINQPDLHALKKYATGPSFSLLHGSWLCQDLFSHFGH